MTSAVRGRPVRTLIILLAVTFGQGSSGCAQDPAAPASGWVDGGLNVLFIGNSLTSSNNLPGIVAEMADAAGAQKFGYRIVAGGNMSLEDHWAGGAALSEIRGYDWDFVVMQQGPSSLPENQAHLRHWTARFAAEIRAAGATPALYMVWPAEANRSGFDAVVRSYTLAADTAGALLLPAGAAWLAAWEADPELPLYGADAFHPSRMGSYLAALVIYGGLYDTDVAEIPARLPGVGIDLNSADAAVLKQAAARVYLP